MHGKPHLERESEGRRLAGARVKPSAGGSGPAAAAAAAAVGEPMASQNSAAASLCAVEASASSARVPCAARVLPTSESTRASSPPAKAVIVRPMRTPDGQKNDVMRDGRNEINWRQTTSPPYQRVRTALPGGVAALLLVPLLSFPLF